MAATNENGSHPLRIITIDSMRTRSHLFWRWFSTMPGVQAHSHPYTMPSMFGPDSWQQKLQMNETRAKFVAEQDKTQRQLTIQDSLQIVEEWVASADKANEVLFFNDHSMFLMKGDELIEMTRKGDNAYQAPAHNPSHIPQALLDTLTPIIVIRDPVLSLPSFWKIVSIAIPVRPEDEDVDVFTSLRFSRALFDYFKTSRGKTPIVVNGEDVLWRTKDLGEKLCVALGLDPAGLSDTWEPTPEDMRPKEDWRRALTNDLHESTGIKRPAMKPDEPNLETAYPQWKQDFGEDIATGLYKLAERHMPHYNYLKQFQI